MAEILIAIALLCGDVSSSIPIISHDDRDTYKCRSEMIKCVRDKKSETPSAPDKELLWECSVERYIK